MQCRTCENRDRSRCGRLSQREVIAALGAGVAAAVSVRDGVAPREVDVRAVQEALREQGVDLLS